MCIESTLALYVNYAKETGKKLKSVDSNNADEKTTIIPWGTRKGSNSNITNSNRGETPQEETMRAPPERGGGGGGIAPNHHHHHEPNLVVHRHYDSAHSHEQETADVGVSTQLFRALLIPFSYSYLIAET